MGFSSPPGGVTQAQVDSSIATHAAIEDAHHTWPVDPEDTVDIIEEFLNGSTITGEIGSLGWRWLSGGPITIPTLAANHPGIYGHQTSTTQNTHAQVYLGANTFDLILAADKWDITWIVSPLETTSLILWIGPSESLAQDTDNTVERYGFEYDPGAGDTNWMRVTCDGTTETRESTGVAFAADWFKLRTVRTATGVDFYINGTAVGSITATLPTSDLTIGLKLKNTAALANRRILLDFFRAQIAVSR